MTHELSILVIYMSRQHGKFISSVNHLKLFGIVNEDIEITSVSLAELGKYFGVIIL